jgi:glyoxylase-like metal-dependent hydrolase (beta-lactamase superfamily II)
LKSNLSFKHNLVISYFTTNLAILENIKSMKLTSIETGNFKLDGGAMFGVVPKTIWQKTNPADDNNMCSWAMRCLLIENGKNLILIDTGIGNKQSDKFFSHYHLFGEATMKKSIENAGYGLNEITDVFLTHLHFDHCGGAIEMNVRNNLIEPTFKNATYWSNAQHWKWATEPNMREKASFLKENILPIQESGQLKFIERKENRTQNVFENIDVLFVDGHTDSMMLPIIKYKEHTLVYTADLLPSAGHIPLPYVMGYDTRPLITLAEKENFLTEAAQNNYILFLEHDIDRECCILQQTEKGVKFKEDIRMVDIF